MKLLLILFLSVFALSAHAAKGSTVGAREVLTVEKLEIFSPSDITASRTKMITFRLAGDTTHSSGFLLNDGDSTGPTPYQVPTGKILKILGFAATAGTGGTFTFNVGWADNSIGQYSATAPTGNLSYCYSSAFASTVSEKIIVVTNVFSYQELPSCYIPQDKFPAGNMIGTSDMRFRVYAIEVDL